MLCKAVVSMLLSYLIKSTVLIYILINISTALHNLSSLGSLVPKTSQIDNYNNL